MFPMIPATPRSAGQCCRLEIAPSRRGAAAWIAWLILLCAVVLFAVALPLLVRGVVCVACATSILLGIRSFILLRGANAIRALEWSEAGLIAYVGSARAATSASVADSTFRLGVWLLVLRLNTPEGLRSVLVDGSAQEDGAAFRRLCRWLAWHSRPCSGLSSASTDTIRPKV
jgi:uncharacterized membrane protein YtjA (UPF0391 family)